MAQWRLPTWTKIIDQMTIDVTENTGGITVVYISNRRQHTRIDRWRIGALWIDYQWLTASTSYNFEAAATRPSIGFATAPYLFHRVDADLFDRDPQTTDAVDFASVTTTGKRGGRRGCERRGQLPQLFRVGARCHLEQHESAGRMVAGDVKHDGQRYTSNLAGESGRN